MLSEELIVEASTLELLCMLGSPRQSTSGQTLLVKSRRSISHAMGESVTRGMYPVSLDFKHRMQTVVYLQPAAKCDGPIRRRQQGVNQPVMVSLFGMTGPDWALVPCLWAHLAHSAHAHPLNSRLTAPMAGATGARGIAAPPAGSRHDRSAPPPSPGSAAATAWPSLCHESAQGAAEAGADWHGANTSYGLSDTGPAAGVSLPHLCTRS